MAVVAGMVLAMGLAGCDGGEKEALREKVAALEQQLAKNASELSAREADLATLRVTHDKSTKDLNKANADIEVLTRQIVKLKVERDKLKTENTQLRKRR
jgi:septal ring factor EnvC (AmiA/AmiB activator)